jgi:hypothetical protein
MMQIAYRKGCAMEPTRTPKPHWWGLVGPKMTAECRVQTWGCAMRCLINDDKKDQKKKNNKYYGLCSFCHTLFSFRFRIISFLFLRPFMVSPFLVFTSHGKRK